LGAAIAGAQDDHAKIYVRALPYTIIVVGVVALEVLVLSVLTR
jgi:hypothetical protein